MSVTELTKEISDKHPKVWNKIEIDFETTNYIRVLPDGIYIDCDESYLRIPFSMLYGLLENFFEVNNIHFSYHRCYHDESYNNFSHYDLNIHSGKRMIFDRAENLNECRTILILGACEILEDRL